jgi:hypothetical protein
MRDPGDYQLSGPLVTTGIVALAGGGATGATQLVSPINKLGTVATAGDSVKLPLATKPQVGEQILVINDTAASCDVFPGTGDNINASAANLAFAVGANKSCIFVLTTYGTAGEWNTFLSA